MEDERHVVENEPASILAWQARLRGTTGKNMSVEQATLATLFQLRRYLGWILAIIALVVVANVVIGILIGVSLTDTSSGSGFGY